MNSNKVLCRFLTAYNPFLGVALNILSQSRRKPKYISWGRVWLGNLVGFMPVWLEGRLNLMDSLEVTSFILIFNFNPKTTSLMTSLI